MIRGQIIRTGTMFVEGEELQGLFIECPDEEMKCSEIRVYDFVEVRKAQ